MNDDILQEDFILVILSFDMQCNISTTDCINYKKKNSEDDNKWIPI